MERLVMRAVAEDLNSPSRAADLVGLPLQYRICFNWSETGPEDVEIVDYH